MFNFDTTFTKGKASFKIVDNNLLSGEGESWVNISAVAGNALIRHWLDNVIIPQVYKKTPSTDFDTLVKEAKYLVEALDEVKSIKSKNCSYSNKSRETLIIEADSVNSRFNSKIQDHIFSPAQQLLLKYLTRRSTNISTSDLQELYNPVTDDLSKLTKWWEDLNDFDYDKYGVNKDTLLKYKENRYCEYYGTCADTSYNRVLERIENFKALVAEAGEDLINWSEQKISLRFTKLGIKCKAWEVGNYTRLYIEHLVKKGITKVDKKAKTSKAKLIKVVEKGGASVEDCFRYYKQTGHYEASNVLDQLDLEHLYKIIDSDLKCITSKLSDKWNRRGGDTQKIVNLLCEKSVTSQDYKKIITWATPALVNESFMIKHMKDVTLAEAIKYCNTANISRTELINEDFYQKCLVNIPSKVKFTLNQGLTNQYIMRMNESEKVKMLERIATEDVVDVDYETLHGLYSNVNYSLIRDTILKNKTLQQFLCGLTIDNSDNNAMLKCAMEVADYLRDSHKLIMFAKFTFDEKKKAIKADRNSCNFKEAIDLLTDDETLELLSEIIDSEFYGQYVVAIFKKIGNNIEANKIVKSMQNPDYLPLDSSVIASLSVSTKVELLNKDISLKYKSIYLSYNKRNTHISTSLGINFFKDFKREDIDKVIHSPVASQYRKFLAHTMTKEELELCVTNEIKGWHKQTNHSVLKNSFLRHNLSLLSYSFVKQFKDKQAFRLVVGDRRDYGNKRFGQELLDRMKVSQSIDFMFS